MSDYVRLWCGKCNLEMDNVAVLNNAENFQCPKCKQVIHAEYITALQKLISDYEEK